jgi:hypothetical protein
MSLKKWSIYDLNPGDKVVVKKDKYNYGDAWEFADGKEFEIDCMKLNDSFPCALVNLKKQAPEKDFVENILHIEDKNIAKLTKLPRNSKRWQMLVDCRLVDIGTKIKNSEFNKFNWQVWGIDGFYHCPFCDKKLNKADDIDNGTLDIDEIKTCDCNMWAEREAAYEEWRETQDLANRMKEKILGDSNFSFEI